jgi:undecaprenyl-diphosphatase
MIFILMLAILVIAELIYEVYLSGVQTSTTSFFPSWLQNWDLQGFITINERLSLAFLDPVMWFITHLGSTILWLGVAAFLWAVKKRREAVLLAIGIIIGGVILLPVKILIPRARPYLIVQGARTLDIEGGGSFPSGHSKNGFTAAAILGSKWKKLRLPLYILACLIAISRIYVGVHWPSDVVVGSIVGWIIGEITMRYEDRIISLLGRVGLF